MRLLPDLSSRLSALLVVYPTLWDRGNLADIIRDLDQPVSLPLPKAAAAGPEPASPPPPPAAYSLAPRLATTCWT